LKTLKNKERDIKHQRKEEVEEILLQLERLISPVEQDAVQGFVEPELPVILIMGCARSGSTFLMQALADSGAFCYPTNLMSRFYYAPYIGSLLQRLLIDYDYKGEILGAENKMTFQSELGKTAGANSPHEFWYFWRRFFQFGSLQRLSDQDLEGVETHLFLKELASIQAVFQQPLLMKGMILNWNIPFLARIMKTAHFVFIEREILFNAQSLLSARQQFFGDKNKWYSFLPPEYEEIRSLTPEEQVVQQVAVTNRAIEEGLSQLPNDRFTKLAYEDLCQDPTAVVEEILKQLQLKGKASISIPTRPFNEVILPAAEWKKLKEAASRL
jgi:hypothetical protein